MKKLWQVLLALALSLALVFSFTACGMLDDIFNSGGEDDKNQDETSGDDETAKADPLGYALGKLAEEEYVTVNFQGDYTASEAGYEYEESVEITVQLAKNADYGYDARLYGVNDGHRGDLILKDGVGYTGQERNGEMYYTKSNDVDLTPIPMLTETVGQIPEILQTAKNLVGWSEFPGIYEQISDENGGRQLTLELDLEEMRLGLLDKLDALDETPLASYSDLMDTLFDEDITLNQMIEVIDGELADYDVTLEDILCDPVLFVFIASIPINSSETGRIINQIMENWMIDPAQAAYEFLRGYLGEALGSVLAAPEEGETVYAYLTRCFGAFKVTGLIDLFSGESGSGARVFAEIKQGFAQMQQEGMSVYDLLEWALFPQEESGYIRAEFSRLSLEGSRILLECSFDGETRLTSISFDFELDADVTFSGGRIETYLTDVTAEASLSYDALTISAPADEYLIV